jgi:uncharacterized protein YjbI with pentapeptide repeats
MSNQTTMTDRRHRGCIRRCYNKMCPYGLKVISGLLLPLLLAIFTVVITFEQKNDSQQQRFKDRELARIQRDQDLNVSHEQRTLERTLADEKRLVDIDLSERIRHSNIEQRKHEVYIQEENRRDAEFAKYITEMGQLLKENNGSLTSDSTTHALARAKTLHTIRQIGSSRCVQLIHFLYDAKQLRNVSNFLDLSGALLNGIDLSGNQLPMTGLLLPGTYLVNASFANRELNEWNFSGAHLHGANFTGSIMIDVLFKDALLPISSFISAKISGFASFSDADLTGSSFYRAVIIGNHFFETNLRQVNFTEAQLGELILESNLADASFYRAKIHMATFSYCNMTRINMTDAIVTESDFEGSTLSYATLVRTHLRMVSFLYSNLSHANFRDAYGITNAQLNRAISLHETILPDGTIGSTTPYFELNLAVRCNMSVSDNWDVTFGEITIQPFFDVEYGPENCVIAPITTSSNGSMGQGFTLNKYFSKLLKDDKALLAVGPARIGSQTHVIIRQGRSVANGDFELLDEHDFIESELPYRILLDSQMNKMKIEITFFKCNVGCWFHNIPLGIEVLIETP